MVINVDKSEEKRIMLIALLNELWEEISFQQNEKLTVIILVDVICFLLTLDLR